MLKLWAILRDSPTLCMGSFKVAQNSSSNCSFRRVGTTTLYHMLPDEKRIIAEQEAVIIVA